MTNDVIRDILTGNKDSFRVIMEEFNELLLRIAFGYTGDWQEAADVTQNTYLRVYRALASFDQSRSFRHWLLTIHTNCCRSFWQRTKVRLQRVISLEQVRHLRLPGADFDETEEIIGVALKALSVRQREAFLLVDLENYCSADAAQILGCQESTLRVHLARARKKLRQILRELGVDYE